MVCHLRYFDLKGYFKSIEYVKNMGINWEAGSIFDIDLEESDKVKLEEAIKKSDEDSQRGNLPGIVDLIQLVEGLQDKYGVAHDHKHPTEAIVKSMCDNKGLVDHYGLGALAKKLDSQSKPDMHTHTHTYTKGGSKLEW